MIIIDMKVIFVIVSMAGGGAERVISILANQFVKMGIDVTIMMTAGNEVAYPLDARIHLLCAGERTGGSLKKRLKRIGVMRQYFKANRDSIIISFGPGTSFFAVVADTFLGHRMLISERNDPAVCEHKKLRNLIYGRADRLVFQTEDAMNCFPKYIVRKGCVIPNPISGNLPVPYYGEREKSIVAVGRLEAQKNHKMLLKAFFIFHQKFPEYKLYIYGEGSLRGDLEEQILDLKLEDAVLMEGFVENIPEKIQRAGIYVLSSNYEGISNSLLEAMAIGLPSISTDSPIGGARLCIDSGVNGILTPVGDEKAFAEAMIRIASDQELAKRLSSNALRLKETYSKDNISRQWIEIMESLELNGKK